MVDGECMDPTTRTTGRTSGRNGGRPYGAVQIAGRVSGRRRWSVDQKLKMLGDAFSPGSSIAAATERHEVSSGQLYTWRRQLLDGELGGLQSTGGISPRPDFVRVELAPPLSPGLPPERRAGPAARGPDMPGRAGFGIARSGMIEIELGSGGLVRVDAFVDGEALRRVLDILGHRPGSR